MVTTSISISLQPYRFYYCCVAAVNEAGKGDSSCQKFITHETGNVIEVLAHTYTSKVILLAKLITSKMCA